MSLVQSFYDMFENPSILGVCTGMLLFLGPIWVAFLAGVVIGWAWKPKWASLRREELSCSLAKSFDWCSASSSPSKSAFSSLKGSELQSPNPEPLLLDKGMNKRPSSSPPTEYDSSSRYFGFYNFTLSSIIPVVSLNSEIRTWLVLDYFSFIFLSFNL